MIIKINKLQLPCSVGVYDFEKTKPRTLAFNVIISANIENSAITDNVEDTIDYDKIVDVIENTLSKKHYDLIETISKICGDDILNYNKKINSVEIEVTKPDSVKNSESSSVIYVCSK